MKLRTFFDLTSPTPWVGFRVSFSALHFQVPCKITAEVMNMAAAVTVDDESLDRRRDRQEKSSEEQPHSSPPPPQPVAAPPPSRRRDRDERDRRDDRDADRPPNRRGDNYDRNRSPPPLPPRERDRDRDRDYKRRNSLSPPPPYRDRRQSPPRRSPPPPYKRSRRDDGGYDGRKGSPRGGFGPGDRRFGYDHGGGYDREMRGRPGYVDERSLGRYIGRSSGGYQDWDSNRGGHGDALGAGQREGLMTYKQFIQELEDDILPAEAERRYQEYKSEYITTQKQTFFDSHKDEEWLRDKYHPTNLVTVIERRTELAQRTAKEFLLDLQSGTLDLGPGISGAATNKSGHTSEPNSDDEADNDGKRRRHGRGPAKEMDLLSSVPKAHPVSSEPRRIQIDIEQAQALVRKLDAEKGVKENILCGSDSDKLGRDKAHGGSSGPVIIIRGLTTVKGLEGVELLDTLLTYLWRIHGLDYYGMVETREARGLRHAIEEGKNSNMAGADEWEKKLDLRWQERLRGQDPLEAMTAKDKIEAAAHEAFEPYVRKIRDEKYGWKYGCGAKGCTKLFHAPEFVYKHLNLKHPELLIDMTSKVREELYFQNYMNDVDAPGGTPVMQQSLPKDKPQRRRMNLDGRLKDDRGNRRDRDNRANGGDGLDRSENPQSSDFQSTNDGTDGGNLDDSRFDTFGGQGRHIAPFASEMPPPVLMPVPGAGPLGPFVPAPPEVAMRMLREQGGPPPFEGGGRNGSAPILALSSGFRQDPRRIRSYQDLDAPEDEVTVIDYRSL